MRASNINFKIQSRAFLALFLVVSGWISVHAGTITKKNFTITYQNNWEPLPLLSIPGLPIPAQSTSDSTYTLIDTALGGAISNGNSFELKQNISAATFIGIWSGIGLGISGLPSTDSSTLVLGKYSFISKGFVQAQDSSQRVRMYATSQGSIVFIANIVYPSEHPEYRAQMEAAMATLNITASAGIHSQPFSKTEGQKQNQNHFNILGQRDLQNRFSKDGNRYGIQFIP